MDINLKNWKELDSHIQSNDKSLDVNILNRILKIKENFFSIKYKQRSNRTRVIKSELVKLGHDLNYKVYANGLSDVNIGNGFVNKEWLFDLIWYKEKKNTDYILTELLLAMECEWEGIRNDDLKKIKFGAVKYDFQKLVVSNSKLKLLVFKANCTDLDKLTEYFINAIRSFENIQTESTFIFISFDNYRKKIFYKIINT